MIETEDLKNLHVSENKKDSNRSPTQASSPLLKRTENDRFGPDLRERSLAMYKSISNMLTLVKKSDIIEFTKVNFKEAKGFALDFAYRQFQAVGPLKAEEAILIRNIVENIITNNFDQAMIPISTDHEIEEKILDKTTQSDNQNLRTIDCTKLRELINTQIQPLIEKKKTEKQDVEYNDKIRVEISVAASIGGRKCMEDSHIVINHFNELMGFPEGTSNQIFLGIYDGHSGNAAAEYSRIHLHTNIASNEHFFSNINLAFEEAYKKTDQDFNDYAVTNSLSAGTTAVTIFIRENTIYTANVGDSEAVLCRNGVPHVLSTKHLPDNQDEKERLIKGGAAVVWYGAWRVNGILSVSRSIGDHSLSCVVIPSPTIR